MNPRLYRTALGGLALVLLLLRGFGIVSARRTDGAARRVGAANALGRPVPPDVLLEQLRDHTAAA